MTPRLVIAAAIIAVGVALPQYQEDARAQTKSVAVEAHREGPRLDAPEGGSGRKGGGAEGSRGAIGTVLLGGLASWYGARGNIAAAGPALRDFLGPHWRGTLVRVTSATGQAVVVRVVDYCGCHGGGGRLIDLSDDAFRQLAPLSVGVLGVTIQRIGRAPIPPATDTAP